MLFERFSVHPYSSIIAYKTYNTLTTKLMLQLDGIIRAITRKKKFRTIDFLYADLIRLYHLRI